MLSMGTMLRNVSHFYYYGLGPSNKPSQETGFLYGNFRLGWPPPRNEDIFLQFTPALPL